MTSPNSKTTKVLKSTMQDQTMLDSNIRSNAIKIQPYVCQFQKKFRTKFQLFTPTHYPQVTQMHFWKPVKEQASQAYGKCCYKTAVQMTMNSLSFWRVQLILKSLSLCLTFRTILEKEVWRILSSCSNVNVRINSMILKLSIVKLMVKFLVNLSMLSRKTTDFRV